MYVNIYKNHFWFLEAFFVEVFLRCYFFLKNLAFVLKHHDKNY